MRNFYLLKLAMMSIQKHGALLFLIGFATLTFTAGSCSFKPLTPSDAYTKTDTLYVDGELWVRHYYGKRHITYEINERP